MFVGLLDVHFISRLENGLNFFIAAFVNCAKQVAYDHCFSITFDKNYHVHVAAIETFAQWSHREIEWLLHQYSWVGPGLASTRSLADTFSCKLKWSNLSSGRGRSSVSSFDGSWS